MRFWALFSRYFYFSPKCDRKDHKSDKYKPQPKAQLFRIRDRPTFCRPILCSLAPAPPAGNLEVVSAKNFKRSDKGGDSTTSKPEFRAHSCGEGAKCYVIPFYIFQASDNLPNSGVFFTSHFGFKGQSVFLVFTACHIVDITTKGHIKIMALFVDVIFPVFYLLVTG